MKENEDWRIYQGSGIPHEGILKLPDPPAWRPRRGDVIQERKLLDESHLEKLKVRGQTFISSDHEIDMVNTAMYLRRPLLITGKPGTGKSSLAYAVSHELNLGPVLVWPITSRSNIQDALYSYDAIGRLQAAKLNLEYDIGHYVTLGPVGTALLPSKRPRVLLIDEIDKSDIDLPNDLLHLFEEGEYKIPELARLSSTHKSIEVNPHDGNDRVPIVEGEVKCHEFPIVMLTSNGERELPPALLRRCLRLDVKEPDKEKLAEIVRAHFGNKVESVQTEIDTLIADFLQRKKEGDLATDQLLNAIHLSMEGVEIDKEDLINTLFRHLTYINQI